MKRRIKPPNKVSSIRLAAAVQHLFAASSSPPAFCPLPPPLPPPSSASRVCQRCGGGGGGLAVIPRLGKQGADVTARRVSTREAEPLPGRCHHAAVYTEGCPPQTPPPPGRDACEGKVTHPRASRPRKRLSACTRMSVLFFV